MIAANELRIGNWFQQDASNNNAISRFFTVDEIKRYGVRSTYIRQDTNQPHTSLFSLDSIHPIPLTPEILEKCGFVKNNTACYFGLGNYYIHYQIRTSVVGIAIINDDDNLDADEELSVDLNIKHLHQLQNLYFALTNTELNYTP